MAQFKVKRDSKSEFLFGSPNKEVYILAWTTTPWDASVKYCVAVARKLATSRSIHLILILLNPSVLFLHRAWLEKYFPDKNKDLKIEDYKPGDMAIPFQLVKEFAGKDLVGVRYEQLMPYMQPLYDVDKAFIVIPR